jgi:hypothetical protein
MTIATDIYATFEKWLTLPDTDSIDVTAGAVLANRLPGPSIFLVLVGPSGSGKSEIVMSLRGCKGVIPLSDLTSKTFLSGKMDEEQSLLLKIPKDPPPIFTVKDLTTLLSKRKDERDEIMGQLREVYDGYYSKAFGGTKNKEWEGKVGLIAACTAVYDEVSMKLSALGERFLVYRPLQTDPIQLAERAQRATELEKTLKSELQQAMKQLDQLKIPPSIAVSYEIRQYLATLCAFLARLRTAVPRDHKHNVVHMPEVESTGRLAKQFAQLIRGITIFRGLSEPYDDEVRLIEKVALSSVPTMRLRTAQNIPLGGASVREISGYTGIPRTVQHRILEDLALLDLVEGESKGWTPKQEHALFFALAQRL